MKKIKKTLRSENDMKAVNALLFLALLLSGRGVLYIPYLLWIIYRWSVSKTVGPKRASWSTAPLSPWRRC